MSEVVINKLVRSRRRTVGLEITRDARLVVRAPRRIALGDIQRILFKKKDWIARKQRFFRQRRAESPPKQFIDGEFFYYLGCLYPLKLVDTGPIRLTEYLEFPRPLVLRAREHLVQWYKARAYEKIRERLDWYAQSTGWQYAKMRISDAQKRLGSCSAKGNLNFSWRLVMAPLAIIDYLVVHELVHLDEKNHARRFWDKVGQIIPDYKQSESFLKNNHRIFELDTAATFPPQRV